MMVAGVREAGQPGTLECQGERAGAGVAQMVVLDILIVIWLSPATEKVWNGCATLL